MTKAKRAALRAPSKKAAKKSPKIVTHEKSLVVHGKNLTGFIAKAKAMRIIPAASVRKYFSETIDVVRLDNTRLVIGRHGKGVAAIVPMDDVNFLQAMEDADDIRVAEERLKAIREGRSTTITAADLYKKLGI